MSVGAWVVFLAGVSAGFFCALVTGAFIGAITVVEAWWRRKS